MVESTSQTFDKIEALVEAFNKATETNKKFIVYLTGAVNAEDGKSWCPDCDVARPSIAEYLGKYTNRPIIKGEVQTRDEWVGVKDHPYKVHPLIKAGGVPSMILFEGKSTLHRVEDLDDFKNEGLMKMFFEDE